MDMIKEFDRKNIIPDAETDEQAVKVYYRFFTPEDEKKY